MTDNTHEPLGSLSCRVRSGSHSGRTDQVYRAPNARNLLSMSSRRGAGGKVPGTSPTRQSVSGCHEPMTRADLVAGSLSCNRCGLSPGHPKNHRSMARSPESTLRDEPEPTFAGSPSWLLRTRAFHQSSVPGAGVEPTKPKRLVYGELTSPMVVPWQSTSARYRAPMGSFGGFLANLRHAGMG